MPRSSAATASREDGADLVAQEQHRHGEQDRGRAHHPENEDVGIGRVGGAAPGDHPQDRLIELNPDLDEVRAADRVDPERQSDLLADLVRQRTVEQEEERFWQRRRQGLAGKEVDVEAEPVRGDPLQHRIVRARRQAAVEVDQGRDVLHQRLRQPEGDRLPVPLHEEIGDHALQQHHRDHEDQQGARIEPLGQAVGHDPGRPHPPAVGPDQRERRQHAALAPQVRGR